MPSNAFTISSASHSVPDPLRSTSAGGIGMILHSEKMKRCTYFRYR